MENLPLKIREVHEIRIHDAQGPHASCGQVQGRRRAEAPGPHQENPRPGKGPLAFGPHVRKHEMTGVPDEIFPLEPGVGGSGRSLGPVGWWNGRLAHGIRNETPECVIGTLESSYEILR